MKLSEMQKIAEARTKGEWKWCYDGSSDWSIGLNDPQVDTIANVGRYGPRPWEECSANTQFIALAANNFDKLLSFVEAAKNIFSFFQKVDEDHYYVARDVIDLFIKKIEELEKE